ncbi:MAG: hypothetical protein FWF56_06135 [Firmicutes bacterium]|nr:hypothetical protein [Bacillota bacterium]
MSRKKFYLSILTLLVAIVLSLTILVTPTTFGIARAANNDWTETTDWGFKNIEIANGSLESHSGNLPASPDSWENISLSPTAPNNDIIKAGVIELTNSSYAANRDNYEMDDWFDQNTFPQTPLTNKNVLLLNTNGLNTAYGYKSTTLDISTDSFFRLTTYVRTGDFVAGTGAAISINGLKDTVSFVGINTYGSSTSNHDWVQYAIYFQTGKSNSIDLTLSVGHGNQPENDTNENKYKDLAFTPANGYAMFGGLNLQKLSPELYNKLVDDSIPTVESNHVQIKDKSVEIWGQISRNFAYDPSFRTQITPNTTQPNIVDKKGAYIAPVIDENGKFNDTQWKKFGARIFEQTASIGNPNNNFGLTQHYRSPNFLTDSTVLLMSSYDPLVGSGEFSTRAINVTLKDKLTILRQEYYRMDIWVNTQSVSDGVGAYIHIGGESNVSANDWKQDVFKKNIVSSDSVDTYGWSLQSVFFKGSTINDKKVEISFGLGHEEEGEAKGVAMFTNPTMHSLTASEFATQTSVSEEEENTNTIITFDEESESSKITNGNFNSIQPEDVLKYPSPASSWEYITPSTSSTTGWSNNAVNTDNVLHGIVPTTPVSDNLDPWNKLKNRGISKPTSHPSGKVPDNLMLISSLSNTAYGFKSNQFSFDADTNGAIQTTLLSQTNGYGANLVLKKGSTIISTIENINTNGKFETFTFFVQADSSEMSELTLEIWLGLGDNNTNNSKLANGYVFVSNAQTADFDASLRTTGYDLGSVSDFDTLINHYSTVLQQAIVLNDFPKYNVYTQKTDTFISFDRYDTRNLRQLYQWTHSSLGGNSTINNNNSRWGVFDIATARGNDQVGNTELIPTNWIPNPDYSALGNNVPKFIVDNTLPNFVHQTRDSDNTLQESTNPYVMMLRHTQPTASKLSSNIKFSTSENSYYKVAIKLKADLTALTDDAIGLGIQLNGTDFKFSDIRDTRQKASSSDSAYKGWWADEYKEFIFYVKTSTEVPKLSIDITLGGSSHSREYAIGTVYVNDITYETMTANDFEKAISNDLDYEEYFEHRLEHRIYADIDLGVPGPPPSPDLSTGVGSINWALLPSVLFAIFLILILFIIFINGFSKRAEINVAAKPKPKKLSYDRNQAVQKSLGTATVDAIDSYELFDDDNLTKNEVATTQDPSLEYEEVEIQEEIFVEEELEVEELNFEEEATEEQRNSTEINEEDQIAIIQQLDEEYDDEFVAPTTRTVKQTITRTVLVPKKTPKSKNDFEDGFDD